jgi:hypothetical protein
MGRGAPDLDEIGTLGSGQDRGAGAHGVADHHRRATELRDEGDKVTGGLNISVGGEGCVAVAMAAQVGTRDPVAGVAQGRCEEAVGGSEVAHARYE